MSWADGVIAAFDLETTGFSPNTDEIVQIALVHVDSDGRLLPDSWSTLVDPGRPIAAGAFAVHGISNERAEREGISAADAALGILERLEAIAAARIPLVVYNAPFDLGFMRVRAERLNRSLPELIVIDPLAHDRRLDPSRLGSRKLVDVARHYECEALRLHDATNDAVVSVAVARAMARRYPEFGGASLDALYAGSRGGSARLVTPRVRALHRRPAART